MDLRIGLNEASARTRTVGDISLGALLHRGCTTVA
jgi:hypothetical protein